MLQEQLWNAGGYSAYQEPMYANPYGKSHGTTPSCTTTMMIASEQQGLCSVEAYSLIPVHHAVLMALALGLMHTVQMHDDAYQT